MSGSEGCPVPSDVKTKSRTLEDREPSIVGFFKYLRDPTMTIAQKSMGDTS